MSSKYRKEIEARKLRIYNNLAMERERVWSKIKKEDSEIESYVFDLDDILKDLLGDLGVNLLAVKESFHKVSGSGVIYYDYQKEKRLLCEK